MIESANRRVVKIKPTDTVEPHDSGRLFDFIDRNLIILLGDPGAGKTFSFDKMAHQESVSRQTVRLFLSRNGDNQERTVYLDGFDECRPRANRNAAIEVLQLLRKNGNPRLRLSCRFVDWVGTDLDLFKGYSDDYVVLRLEPLNQEEAFEIISGKGIQNPELFLEEAAARNIHWAVSNPQSLLMLANVFRDGWPATRRDLFEQWSLKNLTERNPELCNSDLGGYISAALLAPAGAACAALLISDVDGISLAPSLDERIPNYQSVPFPDKNAVFASLSRKIFSSREPNVVTYIHRTIAEYLGARWLGEQCKNGLPLSRIQALIGVDSRPSSSLRGLHAWLPLFMPLQAQQLISSDPLGVLIYGDVASFHPSLKSKLIKAIGTAVSENLWLLNQDITEYGLVGLATSETAEQLIEILKSVDETLQLKNLVLRAILAGAPLEQFRPQLEAILSDPSSAALSRELALEALLRKFGDEGRTSAVRIYLQQIKSEKSSIRLRASIICNLFGSPIGPADVAQVLIDASEEKEFSCGFSEMQQGIPDESLLEILELYLIRSKDQVTTSPKSSAYFEALVSVETILDRVCEAITEDDLSRIDRLLGVLKGLYENRVRSCISSRSHHDILAGKPDVLRMLVDSAVRHMQDFKQPVSIGFIFISLVAHPLSMELLITRLWKDLESSYEILKLPGELLQKYDALGRCLVHYGVAKDALLFQRFMELGLSTAEGREHLQGHVRQDVRSRRESSDEKELAAYYFRVRIAVQENHESILKGEALDLLGELSKLYCLGSDNVQPKIRRGQPLIAAIGEELAKSVEQGFRAMAMRQPAPELSDLARTHAANKYRVHWYSYMSGIDLVWEHQRAFDLLSNSSLSTAFALSLIVLRDCNIGNVRHSHFREWPSYILRNRPEAAKEACRALLKETLKQNVSVSDLLRRFPDPTVAPWLSDLALEFLSGTAIVNSSDLELLCRIAAHSSMGKQQLADIANQRIVMHSDEGLQEAVFWIVLGFLSNGGHESELTLVAKDCPKALWIVRSLTSPTTQEDASTAPFQLSVQQMGFIINTFGPVFKFPPESYAESMGHYGDKSDSDAMMYLQGLIQLISSHPEGAAGECLNRLLGSLELQNYHPWISSKLNEQRELNRQSRYEKPTWDSVCQTLQNGPPANVEDLKALFLDTLSDAAKTIRNSNLDSYEAYWTDDKPKQPRDEDYCRDRLVEFLRLRLSPLNILVEPEGHMAADKRADIMVFGPKQLKLPVEVKRDKHNELWTALMNQLERLYARDPEANGYGIYLVIYFGPERKGNIASHPQGALLTGSPEELQRLLNASIPDIHQNKISCIVVDVSPPSLTRSKELKAKAKGGIAAKKKPKNSKRPKPKGAAITTGSTPTNKPSKS